MKKLLTVMLISAVVLCTLSACMDRNSNTAIQDGSGGTDNGSYSDRTGNTGGTNNSGSGGMNNSGSGGMADRIGDAVGNAAGRVGEAVGDVADGIGDAAGNMTGGAAQGSGNRRG